MPAPVTQRRRYRRPPGRRGGALLAAVALGFAAAACNADDPAEPPQDTPPAEPAQVAQCVTGDWRTTAVEGRFGNGIAEGQVGGGAGVALTVDPTGAATVDFAGMEPAVFEGQFAGTAVSGQLIYDGQATGTVRTDVDTTAGGWEPVDTVDWSGVRVTTEIAEPVEGRPLDGTPLGDVVDRADEITGGVVDVDPVLGEGDFECRDNGTLVLRTAAVTGLTWFLAPA